MKKILGYILTPIFLVVWLTLLNLFHILQFLALNLFGASAQQRVVAGLNGLLVHSVWLLGARVSFTQAAELPAGRPLVFVANHQNKMDVGGISWYLRRHAPKFVSKIELARGIPSVSYNLRHSGAALIDRDDPRQALKEIGRLGKLIESTRSSAVIFPEGTRSLSGRMAPFQAGGVKTLLKHAPSALVVPIYIHDTWALNRYGGFPMSVGERIGWHVLEPIEPASMSFDEVVALAERRIRAAQDSCG